MSFQKALCLVSAVFALFLAVPAHAQVGKKVDVLIFSDEGRYLRTLQGVLDQLKKEGFSEPAMRLTVVNARGSKAKAADAVRKFAAGKPDLVVAIGTTATIAVTREIRDLPVVFGMVYDPVEVKIAKSWSSSGNNTTGVSPRVPIAKLVHLLMDAAPVRRLAILYTPGEKNSETQLKELQGVQGCLGLSMLPVALTRKEEVAQLLPSVVRSVDAIYLTGSSVVGDQVSAIVSMATRGKVVTVTHLDDLVDSGVLIGVCADPYRVGRVAGEKAAKVLRGIPPASIPIESLKKMEIMLNSGTARRGGFQLSPSFLKKVTKTVK